MAIATATEMKEVFAHREMETVWCAEAHHGEQNGRSVFFSAL